MPSTVLLPMVSASIRTVSTWLDPAMLRSPALPSDGSASLAASSSPMTERSAPLSTTNLNGPFPLTLTSRNSRDRRCSASRLSPVTSSVSSMVAGGMLGWDGDGGAPGTATVSAVATAKPSRNMLRTVRRAAGCDKEFHAPELAAEPVMD